MVSDNCAYCSSSDPDKSLWVQCEVCDSWVHVTCVPIKDIVNEMGEASKTYPQDANQIKRFSCAEHPYPALEINMGLKKRKLNSTMADLSAKRQGLRKKKQVDYISLNEGADRRLKNEHPHMHAFLACFSRWENKTNVMDCLELEDKFNSIKVPLKIKDPENSGMQIPKDVDGGDFTVDTVTRFLGEDYRVDVMDVQSQQNSTWTMAEWNKYFMQTPMESRDRIRNVISLEVSHVEQFKSGLRRPRVVESNDVVDLLWNAIPDNTVRPKVTKYILMSVQNAYTDFHLDFAGTSVYYKVISGSKKFILFPPTPRNLAAYTQWCGNDDQNLIFLGDQLEEGIAMDLSAGDLFMIPCGYIHAVYTPVDTLVIGGNFLTLRDLKTQLMIVDIEKVTKVPKKFTFPQFESVMGKTCEYIIKQEANGTDLGIKNEQKEALLHYIQDPKFKYRPVNFSTKRQLIERFQKSVEA